MMVELFKEISKSKYGQCLLYGLGALVSVAIFPGFSLGWICLNIIFFQIIYVASIVLHELGHATAAVCLGGKVIGIKIGRGETLFKFQWLGITWEIMQVPDCGMVYLLIKSPYFYRLREFIISGAGSLTNLLLILLVARFPKEFITFNPHDFYFFPGIILCLANATIFFGNLSPRYVNIDGVWMQSDSLRMIKLPFLSVREIALEISHSCLCDGYRLERLGNYQQAIDNFSKAIQYDRNCTQAYHGRANTYRLLKDDRQAIDNYQRAIACIGKIIDIEQPNADNYYARALIHYNWMKIDATKLEDAIEDLTSAIGIDRCNRYFYHLRAALYCYSERGSQAIEDFTAITKLQYDTDAFYNRGIAYYQTENYQSAIADLDLAIDLDGNNLSAYYVRGNAKYELQDTAGAFEDYDRAKSLNSTAKISSEDAHGFYARGIAYLRLGHKVRAIEDLQIAESLCIEDVNMSLLKQVRQEIDRGR
jgi:tetratricopeptide (TPR) repeat protein